MNFVTARTECHTSFDALPLHHDLRIIDGMTWNLVDNVQVPNLPAGDNIVGFSYECEQTLQVCQICCHAA